MAERIERYLETAGAQVRWKRVRPALERELRTHLEEQTEAYLAEGMTEDAAEAEAVRQMGDAETVGLALDAVHRPKRQTAILLFAGLAIVLGMYLRAEWIGSSYAFALASGLLACGALLGGYYLDYRCLSRNAEISSQKSRWLSSIWQRSSSAHTTGSTAPGQARSCCSFSAISANLTCAQRAATLNS